MTDRFPDFLNPAIDSSGNTISGAQLFFYRVGTSTKKNTFSEETKTTPNTNPLVADSGGRFGDIFMLTDEQYKVILASATDTDPPVSPIKTWDNVSPVLAPSTFPILSVLNKSANYTVLITDRGALINVDASSGPVTITLLAVATALSGFALQVKKTDSSANIVTIDGDGAETIDGATTVTLGLQNDALDLLSTATAWLIKGEKRLPTPTVSIADQTVVVNGAGTGFTTTTAPLPRSYLAGIALSNNVTDATNDIDIAVGECRDDANTANLAVTTAIGKQIDVSWATGGTVGAPTGGLSSTLTVTNDTWYHVILGLVSGSIEVGFDTSLTGANLVTDHSFTNTRRIGSVRRGTATNLAFVQSGDVFLWVAPIEDVNVTTLGTTVTTFTLTVPTDIRCLASYNLFVNKAATNIRVYVKPTDVTDQAPSTGASPLSTIWADAVNVTGAAPSGPKEVLTDTSAQITARSTAASSTIIIATLGYQDRRGRDA